MKRTDTVTRIVVILLFIAVAAYIGVYFYSSATDRMVTADATFASVTTGGTATGIIVREELALHSSELYIDITAQNGLRVGVGQVIATAMNSELGLQRAERIHELELEISRLSAILGSINTASDITSRDKSINSLLLSLTSAVSRNELDGLDSVTLNLSSLLFTDSGASTEATQAELDSRRAELASLKGSSTSYTREITTDTSGVFSKTLDGYEHLVPADLEFLTPAKLHGLIDSKKDPDSDAFGKIVTDFSWYFAATMSYANAAHLEKGDTAQLDFGRYYSGTIPAAVEFISETEAGQCAVVFRCGSALADTLSMRIASAEMEFDTYEGIRVPTQALRTDEDDETAYVFVVTAMQIERKSVEVLYSDTDFVIVARRSDADALREGNTIVVSGDDVYEGKVLR